MASGKLFMPFITAASAGLLLAFPPAALADEYDDAIADATAHLDAAKVEQAAAQGDIERLDAERTDTDRQLEQELQARDEAFVSLYKLTRSEGNDVLGIILDATSFDEVARALDGYAELSEGFRNAVNRSQETLDALSADREDAENRLGAATDGIAAAEQELADAEARKAAYEEEQRRLEEERRIAEQQAAEEAARAAAEEEEGDDEDERELEEAEGDTGDDSGESSDEDSGEDEGWSEESDESDGGESEDASGDEEAADESDEGDYSPVISTAGDELAYTFCTLAYSKQVRNSDGYPRTESYAEAYESIWGSKGDRKWRAGKTQGRSCDRGVATAVVLSGLDSKFPRSCGSKKWGQYAHMNSSSKWANLGVWSGDESDLMPGDVLIRIKGLAGAKRNHVCMYVGHEMIMDVYNNVLKGTDADVGKPSSKAAWVSSSFQNGTSRGRAPGMGKDGDTHMYVFRYVG